MPRRTRKWSYVSQEAKRLMKLGLSPAAIARRLGVNKSSISRWMKSGRLVPPVTRRVNVAVASVEGQSPEEWAATVRETYNLDATDEQLVRLGVLALGLATNRKTSASVRMTAAGRFQAIVRQHALVTRIGKHERLEPSKSVSTQASETRSPRQAAVQSGPDPRLLIMGDPPKQKLM